MSDRFRVEKQALDVVLTLTDGTSSKASVFLAPHSKIHGGRQTLEELLEETPYFIALNSAEGEFFLAGKAGLAAICSEKGDERELQFCKRVATAFRVAGLGELTGELVVPESHEHFRASDYLNDADNEWIRFERSPQIYWLNKKAIMELRFI